MKRRGFTLVEILVVICIIVLLASILLPVITGVKKKANQVKCMTQLKQVGMAIQMYTQDNDDGYPIGGYDEIDPITNKQIRHNWQDTLVVTSYVKTPALLICPSVKSLCGVYSYGCNRWVMGWRTAAIADSIPRPSNTLLITEKTGYDWVAWEPTAKANNPYYLPLDPRHNSQLNVLFCDGHVNSVAVGHLIMGPDIVWSF